ncbi:MAG: DUF1631 family protein [Gammaproteobacteria bacterium]|nr:MAG: DUF1631 family protein [Gammaproteobacteria bacterium]
MLGIHLSWVFMGPVYPWPAIGMANNDNKMGTSSQAASDAARERIFHELLQQATEQWLGQLSALLKHSDDLFFDLSNRANSNTEQNCYFEAMRETREKSDAIIARFRKSLAAILAQAQSVDSKTDHGNTKSSSTTRTLELLQPEELEQNVAIAGIVSKCRGIHGVRLNATGYRLGWLVHQPLTERNNPLDPQQLCHAFTQALQAAKLHIKARLVLFKQFDQYLVQPLPALLDQLDARLDALGYVPTPPPAQEPSKASSEAAKPHDMHARDFEDLSSLLSQLRTLGVSIPSAPRLGHLNHGPAIDSQELMENITRLQSLYTHKQQGGAKEIRAVVQHILSQRNRSGHPASLAPLDEDVINLVALFFDFVLDDNTLPTCIKLLISRLQLQTLKAALANPSFFDDPQHPARYFIESLAAAGMGCSDDNMEDALLQSLQQSVQTILDDTRHPEEAFTRQCERIRGILQHEQRKATLIEKRTRDAASGQARARHARQQVQTHLYQALRDRYLPESVSNFLCTTWRDVMFQVLLKFGDSSLEWDESILVINELLDISTQVRKAGSETIIRESIPAVLGHISNLGKKAATPTATSSPTFLKLEATCQQWLKGEGTQALMVPLSPLHVEALGQSLANTIGSWDEEIAIEREEKKYASLSFDAIRLADALQPGTWVYRTNPLQLDQGQRCKLAAKIEETDTFIFVDANGFRLFELARRSVAYELQRGRMKPLASGPLFERAFDSISSQIGKLTDEITSTH